VRVHLPREHPGELECLDAPGERRGVVPELGEAALVLLRLDELEQLDAVGEALADALQLADRGLEPGPLAPQFLRSTGRVPDPGILELAVYFFESLALAVVLKDTPSARRGAARGP